MEPAMFLPELENLEREKAVGILSRLILGLESADLNPASTPLDSTEEVLRDAILARARNYVAEVSGDTNESLFERHVLETLENEADARSELLNEASVIDRLSADGQIPSDVLRVSFSEPANNLFKNLLLDDRMIIPTAVRSPDLSEETILFEGRIIPGISVYGKYFNFGSDNDKFLLLVFGSRAGIDFIVSYFVRVYLSDVNIFNANTISDVMRRVVSKYGMDLSVQDWSGRFSQIMQVNPHPIKAGFVLSQNENQVVFGDKKSACIVTITDKKQVSNTTLSFCLSGILDRKFYIAYLFGLNFDKYQSDVRRHMRREKLVFGSDGIKLTDRLIK